MHATQNSIGRRLVKSGSDWEPRVGHSRAIRADGHVFVSGTAPDSRTDGSDFPQDSYGQTLRCFEIITTALEEIGSDRTHIVRTRVYTLSTDDFDGICRAHLEALGDVGPASTILIVARFANPRWRVEVEAEAVIPG
jgi:enamine deaminase RidA (YjgF/YER057c/UK114 family)